VLFIVNGVVAGKRFYSKERKRRCSCVGTWARTVTGCIRLPRALVEEPVPGWRGACQNRCVPASGHCPGTSGLVIAGAAAAPMIPCVAPGVRVEGWQGENDICGSKVGLSSSCGRPPAPKKAARKSSNNANRPLTVPATVLTGALAAKNVPPVAVKPGAD